MRFLKSKRFWLIILTLIIIGVLIYFIFFKDRSSENGIFPENGGTEEKKDKTSPASQIKSPPSNSWHNVAFIVSILDEDLESKIDNDFCEFKVVTYDNGKEYSTDWVKRKCNYDLSISVGKGKLCGFEGKQACWVFIRSKDNADNWHSPSLENKSVAYFNIDWTKPLISKVFIANSQQEQVYPINIEENNTYGFKAKVSDNFKVIGCSLYINDQHQGTMSSPGSCGKECILEKEFTPVETGFYQIFAACKDATGNISKSEPIDAKTNLAPEITSCRVNPVQGDTNAEFNFFVEVSNPDNDILSFNWNFDDNETSNAKNPSHYFTNPGTYEPQVIVSDNQGASDSCTTAWVSVQN